jgi:hypothetical protein
LESISIHRDEPKASACVKTGTVVTAATLNFSRALNYRTVSGSDRMIHSTADSLEEVMTEQDLIKAVNYVSMTKANLDLD